MTGKDNSETRVERESRYKEARHKRRNVIESGNVITETKQSLYEDFNWEAISLEAESSITFNPKVPISIDHNGWTYQQDLFPALIWYWKQIRWLDDRDLERSPPYRGQ